jgi:hypothetical protein
MRRLFIISIILFSVSFGTLSPVSSGRVALLCSHARITQTEVGVRYNNNLVSIQERVYNNGRYFLGLGIWFVKVGALLVCASVLLT